VDLTLEQVQQVSRVPREMGLHEEVEESENRAETENSYSLQIVGKDEYHEEGKKKRKVCDIN